MLYDSAVVGIGRSGTTLVFNLLDNFYDQHTEKNPDSSFILEYEHWEKRKIDFIPNKKIIICKRDLRDILASAFRSVSNKNYRMYNDKIFL